MVAPAFVASYASTLSGNSTPKVVSVTVDAGDVLIVGVVGAEPTGNTFSAPTGGTGFSWTELQNQQTANNGSVAVYWARATESQTFNMSVARPFTTDWGYIVYRFANSGGVGASSKGASGGSAMSLGLTTTYPSSAVVFFGSDYNESSISGRTWRTINSITPTAGNSLERAATQVSGWYSVFSAYWNDVGAAGTKTTGMSIPTGPAAGMVAVEVLPKSFVNLVDDFDDGSLDTTTRWTLSSGGGLTRETGGRGGVLCDTGFNKIQTAFNWAMPVGSGVFVRAYPSDLGGATTECFNAMRFESDAQAGGTDLSIRVDIFNGNILFESRTGHFDGSAVSLTYSATDHAWWRIYRSDATTILYQTAPDDSGSPGTWTTRRTLTMPAWVGGVADISLFFEVHRNNGTSNWFEIDNVNFVGGGAVPPEEGTASFDINLALDVEHPQQGTASFDINLDLYASSPSQGSANVDLNLDLEAGGGEPDVPEGVANFDLDLALDVAGFAPVIGSSSLPLKLVLEAVGVNNLGNEGTANFNIGLGIASTGVAVVLTPVRVLTNEEILTGNRHTSFYLDILDASENPLGVLDGLEDGELDWLANAMVKGAGSLRVEDRGQNIDWLNVRFRPYMRIQGLPDQPLGIFLVSEAPDLWDQSRTWEVKLLDKTTILDQDTIAETFALPAGAVVTDEIISIIESVGITNYAVTASAATLPNAIIWEVGTSQLRIINDLLRSINYFSLYMNFLGQLVAEPYVLPAKRPLAYRFIDGATSIYEPKFRRDVDVWKIPNRFTAIGMGNGTTAALTSTQENNNPNSPFSIASRGRVIGVVERGIEAADQTTLDAYALRRLVELTSPTASVEIKHAPVPGLAVNHAVHFRRGIAGIDHRHVVSRTKLRLNGTALATSTFREVVDL